MVGKASTRAQNRYIAKTYDRINLTVAKGQKENIQAHAAAHSESVNGFIGRAIMETMARDGVGDLQEVTEAVAGAVFLPSDTMEAAQKAAEATGEDIVGFIVRAVNTQAQRDKSSLKLGINLATGDKLKGEA